MKPNLAIHEAGGVQVNRGQPVSPGGCEMTNDTLIRRLPAYSQREPFRLHHSVKTRQVVVQASHPPSRKTGGNNRSPGSQRTRPAVDSLLLVLRCVKRIEGSLHPNTHRGPAARQRRTRHGENLLDCLLHWSRSLPWSLQHHPQTKAAM